MKDTDEREVNSIEKFDQKFLVGSNKKSIYTDELESQEAEANEDDMGALTGLLGELDEDQKEDKPLGQ